jgi:hypothetical protein
MTRARRPKAAGKAGTKAAAAAAKQDAPAAPIVEPPAADVAAPPALALVGAPPRRRAIFIDVENTSSKAELIRVLDELTAVEGGAAEKTAPEISAIGNWRVVGQELARALAERGAQLVHSAPVTRVSDWSDLWIAVSAGIWLGTARPGDAIEIVSHDRAFDAVGDAAARLGVSFRRVTYRATSGSSSRTTSSARSTSTASRTSAGSSRRRGRRGGASAKAAAEAVKAASVGDEPLSAPVDELRSMIGELMSAGTGDGVSLDALTRALKAAGFQRPQGSPRLMTRLRRMKDVEVGRDNIVRLIGGAPEEAADAPEPEVPAGEAATTGRRRRGRRGGRRRGRRGKGGTAQAS